MFTGLVEDVGTVLHAERREDALVLTVRTGRIATSELAIGDSLCHDGVCLTVTAIGAEDYQVLCGAETLACTTLSDAQTGSELNLERALRLGDRLGGHMVAGHVDTTGVVVERRDEGANIVYRIGAPAAALRYVIAKGSIAVDGISLTVNRVEAEAFEVAIIPHTSDQTTLSRKTPGARVNLEVDLIGKYVEKLLGGRA